jgi:hypothetical protein
MWLFTISLMFLRVSLVNHEYSRSFVNRVRSILNNCMIYKEHGFHVKSETISSENPNNARLDVMSEPEPAFILGI